MVPADLFHLVDQALFSHILLISLSLKFRIDIPVKAMFPKLFHRRLIIDALIFITAGPARNLGHIVKLSVNADNIGNNIDQVLRTIV